MLSAVAVTKSVQLTGIRLALGVESGRDACQHGCRLAPVAPVRRAPQGSGGVARRGAATERASCTNSPSGVPGNLQAGTAVDSAWWDAWRPMSADPGRRCVLGEGERASAGPLTQPIGCHNMANDRLLPDGGCRGCPDRIERTVQVTHPLGKVWAALIMADGLRAWFGNSIQRALPLASVTPPPAPSLPP